MAFAEVLGLRRELSDRRVFDHALPQRAYSRHLVGAGANVLNVGQQER
jgi:hypothetical protein